MKKGSSRLLAPGNSVCHDTGAKKQTPTKGKKKKKFKSRLKDEN